MELEFDKEIDAILRKARELEGVAVTAKTTNHLDADAIAAFTENALPQKARMLYMEHFADCDGCRKLLSQLILANTGADAAAALSTAAKPVAETAIPWYSKLFRTPNLAMAMGALVLAFSGVLGYLVIQNRNDAGSTISQVTENKPTPGGPYYDQNAPAAAASNSTNTAANAAAPAPSVPPSAANTTANSAGTGSGTGSATGRTDQPTTTDATGGAPADAAKPVASAPKAADETAAVSDDKSADAEKSKTETKDTRLAKKEGEDRMAREAVPPSISKTGPNRGAGPSQKTNDNLQNQSIAGMVTGVKTAGGKTFENSNGVWYDRAYNGQKTTNVRRGTDTYKQLDGGLRSIAENIGGTVVIVWKNKAYRIQ